MCHTSLSRIAPLRATVKRSSGNKSLAALGPSGAASVSPDEARNDLYHVFLQQQRSKPDARQEREDCALAAAPAMAVHSAAEVAKRLQVSRPRGAREPRPAAANVAPKLANNANGQIALGRLGEVMKFISSFISSGVWGRDGLHKFLHNFAGLAGFLSFMTCWARRADLREWLQGE